MKYAANYLRRGIPRMLDRGADRVIREAAIRQRTRLQIREGKENR